MQITGYVQEQEGEIENHLKEPAQLWKKIIWIVQTKINLTVNNGATYEACKRTIMPKG